MFSLSAKPRSMKAGSCSFLAFILAASAMAGCSVGSDSAQVETVEPTVQAAEADQGDQSVAVPTVEGAPAAAPLPTASFTQPAAAEATEPEVAAPAAASDADTETEDDSAAPAPTEPPAPTATPVPAATTAPEPTEVPAPPATTIDLPQVEVVDLRTGNSTNLGVYSTPGPLLLWFWAPH